MPERERASAEAWDSRLAVNSLSSRGWSLWQDLECYERLGVERISVFLPKLMAAGLDLAVGEIADRGLRVDGILPGTAFDLCEEASWSRTRDTMIAAIEVGRRLRATTLQTTGGSAGGHPYEWAVERFGRALAPVTAAAAAAGIRVALEPTRPQFAHVGFVHTLRDGVALAQELGLWLVPDTAHLWWEPHLSALLTAAAATGAGAGAGGGQVAVVQVADLAFGAPVLERLVPGDGAIPIGQLLAATIAGGFAGPFELEIIGGTIESEGYESAILRSLQHLTTLLQGAADPAPATA